MPEPLQHYFQTKPQELPTPGGPQDTAWLVLTPVVTASPSTDPGLDPTDIPVPDNTPTLTAQPSQEPTVTPEPTHLPTATRTPRPTPTLTPAPASSRSTPTGAMAAADIMLTGIRHTPQTWNNCGPATLTMGLSYYKWKGTQAQAAAFLKPNPEDRNVNPEQLVAFAQAQGLGAIVRVNGSLDLLKALLRAGIPPLVEKGFEPEAKLGWMGHYGLIIGLNEAARQFIAMDSYLGPNIGISFEELDKYWRQFNRTYIVLYRPEQAEAVSQIIGAEMDDMTMYQNALARAQSELAANSQDPFGWFNLGTNYAALKKYDQAVQAYDQARRIGVPWRMTWYQFGWFEAYLATDRGKDVMALADTTLKSNPYSEEMYLYRGLVYQKQGDVKAARTQFELALRYNSNYERARQALATLAQ